MANYNNIQAVAIIQTLRHTVINLNTERKVKMKATQTKTTRKETRYDFRTERKILAPSEIIFFSPARRQEKGMTLLSIYHELVMMKEQMLKKWVLANCKFRVKQPKNDYNLATVHPASKTKLDKYLATDPLGLADEAIRQEWTDTRRIVVQRGKLVYDWKVRIAKR